MARDRSLAFLPYAAVPGMLGPSRAATDGVL